MVELGIFWGLSALLYVFLRLFVSGFKKKAGPASSFWQLHLDTILIRPVELFLAVACLSCSAVWVLKELEAGEKAVSSAMLTRDIALILIVAFGLFRMKKIFFDSLNSRRVKLNPSSLGAMRKLSTLFIGLIATFSMLHILNVNIIPLITFGGLGAAGVAFASKDVFINLFSGLMLYITRPFMVGDEVQLPGKRVEGWIEEIGWFSTMLRDAQKRPVYLPNSLFASEVLINNSRRAPYYVEETIRFRVETVQSLKEMIEKIRDVLKNHPDIDSAVEPQTLFKKLSGTFAELEIKACTLSKSYELFTRVKQEVLLQVYQAIEEDQLIKT